MTYNEAIEMSMNGRADELNALLDILSAKFMNHIHGDEVMAEHYAKDIYAKTDCDIDLKEWGLK